MRIRPIKPEWWEDKALHTKLSAEEREFYIGLWMIADDTGLLVWDPDWVAAVLFRWQEPKVRETGVRRFAAALQRLDARDPHFRVLRCRKHAEVNRLPRHLYVGKWSGNPYRAVRAQHERSCLTRLTTDSPRLQGYQNSDTVGVYQGGGRVVKGSEEKINRASARGGLKDRLGDFEDVVARERKRQ